jgi:hypothetical protein
VSLQPAVIIMENNVSMALPKSAKRESDYSSAEPDKKEGRATIREVVKTFEEPKNDGRTIPLKFSCGSCSMPPRASIPMMA